MCAGIRSLSRGSMGGERVDSANMFRKVETLSQRHRRDKSFKRRAMTRSWWRVEFEREAMRRKHGIGGL